MKKEDPQQTLEKTDG